MPTFALGAPARFINAARTHRSRTGSRWHVDETYLKVDGRWRYVYRAIGEDDQIVDVYLSNRRNATAAQAFFERAVAETGVTPPRVTTDTAKAYPPALRTVLPDAAHRSSKYLNNGLERDHQHLMGRVRPMRGFRQVVSAANFCRGHALIRNLARGFSKRTAGTPHRLRLTTAWTMLAATL